VNQGPVICWVPVLIRIPIDSRVDQSQVFAPVRRGSHCEYSYLFHKPYGLTYELDENGSTRRFLVPVDTTLQTLLRQEDSDGNMQITIEDMGPKVQTSRTDYLL
jgi:hypothetical protein